MAADFSKPNPNPLLICTYTVFVLISVSVSASSIVDARTLGSNSSLGLKDSLAYIWPLPAEFKFGNGTLSVDPALSLVAGGNGGNSAIVRSAFERYRGIVFKESSGYLRSMRSRKSSYDVRELRVVVHSDNEELQLGADESYSLIVAKSDDRSIIAEATIEDLKTRRMIGGRYEKNGLYYLQEHQPQPQSSTSSQLSALHSAITPYQWHCRLGHHLLPLFAS